MTRPISVSSELQIKLVVPGTAWLPVRAGMRYDVSDPYAVQVAFQTGSQNGNEVVPWTFARSLLSEGVVGPAGAGDVRVWPQAIEGGQVVCLSLSSPSGNAQFEIPLADLVEFLTQTYLAVPTGTESDHVDVESELVMLLGAGPES